MFAPCVSGIPLLAALASPFGTKGDGGRFYSYRRASAGAILAAWRAGISVMRIEKM